MCQVFDENGTQRRCATFWAAATSDVHVRLRRNGNGVRSTSRTNRMAGHWRDVPLSKGMTQCWAPSLAARELPSRSRSSRDRRRIWYLDWPHAVSTADAKPPARPLSPWGRSECSSPAATGPRPSPAVGVGTHCKIGSRLPPPACSEERLHG